MENKKEILSPEYRIGNGWLYAPSTYLVDSFSPFVEEIYLPSVSTQPGELSFNYIKDGIALFNAVSYKGKIRAKLRKDEINLSDDIGLDLRCYSPQNVAHAIMIHLPIALWAKGYLLSIREPQPVLIFPESLPSYVADMFVLAGFEILLTNAKVTGRLCIYELDFLIGIRGKMPDVLKAGLKESEFAKKILQAGEKHPKKIFLSRKDTRRLRNEAEIEKYLKTLGYQKIYLEEYLILDQIALVSLADSIVAVHGAALGSLVLRNIFDKPPVELIEIFSPAHMTNVYRIITHQIGGKWVGVRGKVWSNLIKQAYECEADKVRQYSLSDFEVCLLSLEKALSKITEN